MRKSRHRTTDTDPTTPGRRRVLHMEGDGDRVFRTAETFDAQVAVYVAPADSGRSAPFNHPGIALTVHPDGSWTVEYEAADGKRTEVASGHIDNPPSS